MVTDIKNYSTTAGDNNSPSPNGFPEGMAPSGVNNAARAVMAAIREWYETAEWIDYGDAGLTYVDGTNFRVTGDLTARYAVNRRVRATGTTPFTIYGTITASSFSSPNTTVTVEWDSSSMDATLDAVALGIDPTNKPLTASAMTGFADAINALSALAPTGTLSFPDKSELTISSGSVSAPTGVFHTLDTEADASSDDLETIGAGSDGQLLFLMAEDSARDITIKHNTGNIMTADGEDLLIENSNTLVIALYSDALSKWVVLTTSSTLEQATSSAVQSETNEDTYVPPDLVKQSPGVAKAYGEFNGDGGATLASGSYNVNSVSRSSTGVYVVSIPTMANANYVVMHNTDREVGTNKSGESKISAKSTSSFTIDTYGDNTGSQNPVDHERIEFVVFGELA